MSTSRTSTDGRPSPEPVSRRTFLRGVAAAGTVTALSTLLGGCGTGGESGLQQAPSTPTQSSGATAAVPTLEQKIAQMLLVGFRGTTLDPTNPIVAAIRDYGIGGVVLFDYDVVLRSFGRNVTSPAQLQALDASLHALARVPLFVAVDQEGGRVARLKPSCGFPPTVTAQSLGDADNAALTRMYATRIANTLTDSGMNMDFAPVVDLNVNPDSPAIGRIGRSFSADPAIVVSQAAEFLLAFDRARVLGCLKHFPGHGSASADSHLGFVDVTTTWSEIELQPYRELIASGLARMVMTAHIFNQDLDPDYPATLSRPVITGLLRGTLGFQGVVVTDDMQMGAITQHYSYETAVQKAIEAGVDIILVANNNAYDPDVVPRTVGLLAGLVRNGTFTEARIDESYRRIMSLKTRLVPAATQPG